MQVKENEKKEIRVTAFILPEVIQERPFTENVTGHLMRCLKTGQRGALVTLVGVDGSAPRRIGSQMFVSAEKQAVGYISSGCAEAAIIEEAVAAITVGRRRMVRYGAGSKYVDIVLPCGSGIDVHFDPTIDATTLAALEQAAAERRSVALDIDLSLRQPSRIVRLGSNTSDIADPEIFRRAYLPMPRLIVAGRGVGVDYLVRFADELEWEVIVASPDEVMLARVSPRVNSSQHLNRPEDFDASVIDPYSAIVLLFHDHEWEPNILKRCETSPAFFIGALGSRQTHKMRCDALAALGASDAFIQRIKGPVGIDVGAQSPVEISLSIVAEVMQASRQMNA